MQKLKSKKQNKSPEQQINQRKREMRKDFANISIKDKYWIHDVLRIGYLDIECTNLKGNMGYILSWVMMIRDTQKGGERGKIIKTVHAVITKQDIDASDGRHFEDKRIVEELVKAIKKYKIDLLIGHYFYGKYRMDIPFIRTRCIMNKVHGYPKYKQVKYGDTHRMGGNGYSVHRWSLDAIGDMMGVTTKKTPVSGRHWQLAARGKPNSLRYVLHHNKNDVIINWKIHLKMEDHCPIPTAYV